MENKNPLARENIKTLFFKLAIPAVVAQVVNMLYNMVDRMYIGHLPEEGAIALTGIGVSMPLIMLISAFAMLIGGGGAPRASIFLGSGKIDKAKITINTAYGVSLILGIILTVIFFIFLEPLLIILGASKNSLPYAMDYSKIYLLGTVAVMFSLGMNQFISVQGFARESMITTLIGAILNIILDPIFIFALNMGVKGAAIATIISQYISGIWFLNFLMSDKSRITLDLKKIFPNLKSLVSIISLGASPFIMTATESLLQIAFNRSLSKYGGDLYVATMSVNQMIMQFVFLPYSGFAQGGVPIISYNFGAKNSKRVKDAIKILIKTVLSISFIFTLLIELFPGFFVSFFTKDAKLIEAAIPLLRIYMGGSFVIGLQIACQQSFIAFGQAKISIFLALLRKVILLIPLIYILPFFIKPETYGVYFAEPVADIIASTTTAIAFYLFIKKEYEKES